MKSQTFSAMWTDELGRTINRLSVKPYPMEFHRGKELDAVCAAINQGIDSHLEAVHFKQSVGEYGRVKLTLEPQSVAVLVRRLTEYGNDEAQSLASSICDTLGIELI